MSDTEPLGLDRLNVVIVAVVLTLAMSVLAEVVSVGFATIPVLATILAIHVVEDWQ